MADTLNNRQNRYQGQLKATSTTEGYFVGDLSRNYMTQIRAMSKDSVAYLSRVGIYWDSPANEVFSVQQQTNVDNKKPTVNITFNSDSSSQQTKSFQLGHTYVLEFRDVQITGISFNQNSSPRSFIDFVSVQNVS